MALAPPHLADMADLNLLNIERTTTTTEQKGKEKAEATYDN